MITHQCPDVLIIGAGVIGLTTAITFAEARQRVLVRTAEPPRDTTSAAAGALWGPWMAEPADKALRWAEHTLDVLTNLADHHNTGVRLATGRDVSAIDHDPPDWFRLLRSRRPCSSDELPAGYGYGQRYTAPLVDMPSHLAYLVRRLHTAGGTIEVDPVNSLDEAATVAPVVVNCTGLGARALAHDNEIYPIRGQHAVVANPGITNFLEVDTGDSPDLVAIYPHGDHVVLGGTAEPHNWSRATDPATTTGILHRCAKVEPRLHNVTVIEVRAGLRPTRPQIRLDSERGQGDALVIHNYGHGGAGVSLSWGCAATVADIARAHGLAPSPT